MMATEYISRDYAVENMENYPWDTEHDRNSAIHLVRELVPPADVRPVVYCKDCKHSDTFSPDCTEATFPLKCLSIRYGGVFPHWFCEHGERNGGADDA